MHGMRIQDFRMRQTNVATARSNPLDSWRIRRRIPAVYVTTTMLTPQIPNPRSLMSQPETQIFSNRDEEYLESVRGAHQAKGIAVLAGVFAYLRNVVHSVF
ncbi:hypothetical protein C8Q78DRAFT_573026 [Trametes maxima]|nr:hypothetical protein C8Q78DRAFT_573026 [Trametes maxima]